MCGSENVFIVYFVRTSIPYLIADSLAEDWNTSWGF